MKRFIRNFTTINLMWILNWLVLGSLRGNHYKREPCHKTLLVSWQVGSQFNYGIIIDILWLLSFQSMKGRLVQKQAMFLQISSFKEFFMVACISEQLWNGPMRDTEDSVGMVLWNRQVQIMCYFMDLGNLNVSLTEWGIIFLLGNSLS